MNRRHGGRKPGGSRIRRERGYNSHGTYLAIVFALIWALIVLCSVLIILPEALTDLRGDLQAGDLIPGRDLGDALGERSFQPPDLPDIGRALWRCAFGTPAVAEIWRASRASVGPDGVLRLRLLMDSAELAELPWELLYDETLGRFLALDAQTPVTRFTRLPIPSIPWPQDRPLRLLFTGASPADIPTLAVAKEWAGIEQVLVPLLKGGRLETPQPIPEGATLPALAAAMRRKVDIWHFAGHGVDDALVFNKDHGKPNHVSAAISARCWPARGCVSGRSMLAVRVPAAVRWHRGPAQAGAGVAGAPAQPALYTRPPGALSVKYMFYLLGSLNKVPIPPLPEQHRIVAAIETQFSRLDAGVAALKRVQATLRRYKAAVLKAACEGRLVPTEADLARVYVGAGSTLLARILAERRAQWEQANPGKRYVEPKEPEVDGLAALPEGWVWARFDQLLVELKNGYFGGRPEAALPGMPILRVSAVCPMTVSFDDPCYLLDVDEKKHAAYLIEEGDLFFTRYNGSRSLVGACGLVRHLPYLALHPDKLICALVLKDMGCRDTLRPTSTPKWHEIMSKARLKPLQVSTVSLEAN